MPPPGLQVVRAYGLYAPSKGAALAQARQGLGQAPVTVPQPLDWQTYCAQQGTQHPERCPVCGQRLIRTATVAPQRHRRLGLLASTCCLTRSRGGGEGGGMRPNDRLSQPLSVRSPDRRVAGAPAEQLSPPLDPTSCESCGMAPVRYPRDARRAPEAPSAWAGAARARSGTSCSSGGARVCCLRCRWPLIPKALARFVRARRKIFWQTPCSTPCVVI